MIIYKLKCKRGHEFEAWFAGSALLGVLYDRSLVLVAVVSIVAQLLSIIPLMAAIRTTRRS